jgi:glycosyltransferase involved in cell wall biosynthesis
MGDDLSPLFSIIIPAHNQAALLSPTIQSVLNQAMVNQEIIVVDEGSTDGTLDVFSEYRDQVQLLRQTNAEPGAARNAGLRMANGEYVAFLDSGDLWFPWTAGTYAQVIAENNRPAFIAGKPFAFKSDLDAFPNHSEDLKTNVFADYLVSGNSFRRFSASSFVMKRQSLLAVGGFANERISSETLTVRCEWASLVGSSKLPRHIHLVIASILIARCPIFPARSKA